KLSMSPQGFSVPDALIAPWWLLANAVVVWFASATCRAKFPLDRAPQIALGACLVCIAATIASATTLGTVGLLGAWLLLTIVTAISARAILCLRRVGGTRADTATARPPGQQRVVQVRRSDRWFTVSWAALLACLLGHIAVNGLRRFPEEFDGLAYHIPLIDHWLQAKSLYAADAAKWWEPGNAEIIGAWMVAPFSGDFLVPLGNVPFIILWGLATFEVARQLGLSGVWRHLSVLTVLVVHTTFHEAEKAMNDVPVAACFFAAVAFGFRYFQSRRPFDLILASVAAGLLAGVKYFALGYTALIVALVVLGTALAYGWRTACRSALVIVLVAPPFGAYWYVRNYFVTGAPLYPQGVDALGIGYPAPLWSTSLAGNRSPELFSLACEALWKMTGPCHVAAVALAPLSAGCLAWAGLRRLRRGEPASAAVFLGFAALLVGSAAVFAVTPFCVEDQPGTLNHLRWAYTPARYGLCFLSTTMLAFVWLLQQCAEKAASFSARRLRASTGCHGVINVGFYGLLIAGLGWEVYQRLSYLYYHTDLREPPDLIGAGVAGLNLLAASWLAREVWRATPGQRRALAAVGSIAVLFGASAGTAMLSRHWHEGFARHYDRLFGTRLFTHLAKERPGTIAVLDHRPYPFFGSARQSRVCSPMILTTYDELKGYLQVRRPSIVASPRCNTGEVFDRYKEGPEWLKEHSSEFQPLLSSGAFDLYAFYGRVSPRRLRNASSTRAPGSAATGGTVAHDDKDENNGPKGAGDGAG
ncbi:MAG TPA: hypothetical protein PK867_03020, partial [Pirellulales bacterium]|nr:hypothetical protein [Pirellulales bacterium]